MTEVDEALYNLIDTITDTKVWEEYQKNRAELNRNPELRAQVDAYRKRNFELQQSDLDGRKLMEETDKFEKEYENFRADPLVTSFLASELAFARLMQHIYEEIVTGIDFD